MFLGMSSPKKTWDSDRTATVAATATDAAVAGLPPQRKITGSSR